MKIFIKPANSAHINPAFSISDILTFSFLSAILLYIRGALGRGEIYHKFTKNACRNTALYDLEGEYMKYVDFARFSRYFATFSDLERRLLRGILLFPTMKPIDQ